jgi:mannose-6-phosphate isomerase
MEQSTSIFRLEGVVQHYNWGGKNFIPELLNLANDEKKPFAEYWLGAHKQAPSVIRISDNIAVPIDRLIESSPQDALGKKVYQHFSRLPYLFKVLDVHDMLSIQVHPSKADAKQAYANENEKGIAHDDARRNYKDDNHKPEVMYALSEFWLLHGFRPEESMKEILQQIPELRFLHKIFVEYGYKEMYRHVMEMPQEEVNKHLDPLLKRIIPLYNEGKLSKSNPDFWAARAAITFNKNSQVDRGIFSIYMFNLLQLNEGEAIFQDAGVPHAYLEGQNIELMANSDNVLRGGLTNKHVDVPELLRHTVFEADNTSVITGFVAPDSLERIFPTPANDFELSQLKLGAGERVTLETKTGEIFFVYEGEIMAESGMNKLKLRRGEAMFAFSGTKVFIVAEKSAIVFKASVPSTIRE